MLSWAGSSLDRTPRYRKLALSDVEPRFTGAPAIGRFSVKSKRLPRMAASHASHYPSAAISTPLGKWLDPLDGDSTHR